MNWYVFRAAARCTVPVLFGYVAIGIPFGLMVAAAGYPWWLALVMSVFLYTGAGQYVAVGLFAAGVPLPQIVLAELLVGIRHIVYGFSLITPFRQAGRWRAYLIFALTDETYALLTGVTVPPRMDAGAFYGVIALLNQLYWVAGTVIGAAAYAVLAHYNLARWLDGVDFALTALFTVILIEQIKKSRDVVPPVIGLVEGAGAVALCRAGIISATNIMLVAIAAALAAVLAVKGRHFAKEAPHA